MAVVTKTLRATGNNTSLVRASNVVTVTLTTASTPNVKVGDTVVIAGSTATTNSFNGTFTVASVTSTTVFTYAQTGADETATAAGTTGGDYALMSTWESTEQTNLVTDGDTHELHCYADWPSGLTDECEVDLWTTGASNTITIKAAAGHEHCMKRGAGFWMTSSANAKTIGTLVQYVTIQDVEARSSSGQSAAGGIFTSVDNVTIQRCIAESGERPAFVVNSGSSNQVIRNCLGICTGTGSFARVFGLGLGSSGAITISNCTGVSTNTGLASYVYTNGNSARTMTVYNCIGYAAGTFAVFNPEVLDGTQSNNASSDTSATGTGAITNITSDIFVDYANGDYRINPDSTMYNAGTDLSGTFTDDITGETRTQWSIGAHDPIVKSLRNSMSTTDFTRATNVVTVTTTAAHTVKVGDRVVITGCTPASFNGTFFVDTVPTTTTFTYAQTGSDESTTVDGTVGGNFALMSTAENDDQQDLTANNQLYYLECYADWPSGLTDSTEISSWTTDASHYITIKAADGHEHKGVKGSGFWVKSATNWAEPVSIIQAATVVSDLEVSKTTGANGTCFAVLGQAGTVRNCYIWLPTANLYNCYGFGGSTGAHSVENCIFEGGNRGLSSDFAYKTVSFKNCTAVNNNIAGFKAHITNDRTEYYNCVAINSSGYSGAAFENGAYAGSNNASDDLTAPGTSPVTGVTTADFVDFAGGDYRITRDSALYGAGADLSGTFTDDITGTNRTQWSIGMFDPIVKTLRATITPSGYTRATNVVTVTTSAAHTIKVGDTVVISGCTPATFDGRYTVASVPTTTTFTYANTGSDESTTVQGTVGGDFALMSTAESTDQQDLTANNQLYYLECYADWPTGLVNFVEILGWTTGASNTITVKAAAGHEHNGVIGGGFWIRSDTNDAHVIEVSVSYVTVQDIEASHSSTNGATCFTSRDTLTENTILFDRCIASSSTKDGTADGTTLYRGVGFAAKDQQARNCLAINCASSGFAQTVVHYGFRNYNNTAIDCGHYGFYGTTGTSGEGGTLSTKNCVAYGSGTSDWNTYTQTGETNNASGDATAPGTSAQTGVTTSDFVDYAGGDYTPASGSTKLKGTGTDLSGTFTDDITGTTRSTWDIGAYIAAAGGTGVNVNLVGQDITANFGILVPTGWANVSLAGQSLSSAIGAITVDVGGTSWSILNIDLDNDVTDGQTNTVIALSGTVAATGKKVFIEQGANLVEQTVTAEDASSVTITVNFGGVLSNGAATLYVRNPL